MLSKYTENVSRLAFEQGRSDSERFPGYYILLCTRLVLFLGALVVDSEGFSYDNWRIVLNC